MIKLKKLVLISASTVLAGLSLMSSSFATKTEEHLKEYDNDQYRNNCVRFVTRTIGVTDLPGNLYTPKDKMEIIKYGADVCPKAGWVAVVRDGKHVAYVEDANEEDGTITVVTLDGNWTGAKVYRRTGTPQELEINGYWAP